MTVRRAMHTPLATLAREGVVRLASVVKARFHEARATLAIDVMLFLTSLANGLWPIWHPDAYQAGWTLFRGSVTQPELGMVFLLQATLRFLAILSGNLSARQAVSLTSFVLYGCTAVAIYRGNPDSPVIPYVAPALFANVWNMCALEWAKVDRRRAVRAHP